MAFEVPRIIKEHPAASVAVVILGGLGVYLLIQSGNASNASTTTVASSSGLDDAQYAAYTQAQTALDQTAAAAAAQQSQQSYNLSLAQLQGQSNLALQQELDATQITNTNTAAQVANNSNTDQTAVQSLSITDALQGLINNNVTSQNLAQIAANEQQTIAGINANVATTISGNQLQLGVVQSNNNTTVATTQANDYTQLGITQANDNAQVQETISNNQLAGQGIGGALGFLGALF